MRNHADDLAPLSLRGANAKQYPLAYGRFIWKRLRGKCLINYQEISFRRIVVFGKRASGHQGCAHSFKVARQYNLKIGSLKLARVFECFGSAPTHGIESAGQWQRKRGSCTADTGDCTELLAK